MHPYFQCLKRNNRFVWTSKCEESFLKLKEYLASPPVLCKPLPGTSLHLYFAITERAISSVNIQEQDHVQRPIYFVNNVLQGPEVRYQTIEKVTIAIVFAARRLHHYFQSAKCSVRLTHLVGRLQRLLWPFYPCLRIVPSPSRNFSPAKTKGRLSDRLHSDAQVSIRAKNIKCIK